jgi:hypothetical protein
LVSAAIAWNKEWDLRVRITVYSVKRGYEKAAVAYFEKCGTDVAYLDSGEL